MKRSDFHYDLPDHLIARYPLPERTGSRLLCLDGASGAINHRHFTDLIELLAADDLLVFNNTRVIPARLWGRKPTGGKVEILVERLTGEGECLAHVRASKSPRAGGELWLQRDGVSEAIEARLTVLDREGEFFRLQLQGEACLLEVLQRIGHMPLPPYIEPGNTGPGWLASSPRLVNWPASWRRAPRATCTSAPIPSG